jgi:hypothetical protein
VLLSAAIGFLAGLLIWGGLLLSTVGGFDSVSTISSALREMTKPVVNCEDLNSRENLSDPEKILKAANCNATTDDKRSTPAPSQ